MPEAGTLHDAFIDELRDTYDAEKQLTKALPKLAKAASNRKLRAAFEAHLAETQGHVERLEQVFESLEEKVRGKERFALQLANHLIDQSAETTEINRGLHLELEALKQLARQPTLLERLQRSRKKS